MRFRMGSNTEAMRTVSFELPASLDEKLRQLAEAKGVSRSQIVRDLLAGYGSDSEGPSALDLALDLAGNVSGPSDLSTNRRHLATFGKN